MLVLAFLIVIAVSWPTVESVQNATGHKEDVSLQRWIDLHVKLHDDQSGPSLSQDAIKEILDEMSLIERNQSFKTQIKPLDMYRGYPIKHFRELVDKAYGANLLMTRDKTITDLLLQTHSPKSNACTAEYFEQLDGILETFEGSPLKEFLRINRESQYIDCWARFIESLQYTTEVLGSRIDGLLGKLLKFVYPGMSKKLELSSDQNSAEYGEETTHIAEGLAKLLISISQDNNDKTVGYDEEYLRRVVVYPCEAMQKRISKIIQNVYGMLKFSGLEKSFIMANHWLIPNRFILCERILKDAKSISQKVLELLKDRGPINKRQRLDDPIQAPVILKDGGPINKRQRLDEPIQAPVKDSIPTRIDMDTYLTERNNQSRVNTPSKRTSNLKRKAQVGAQFESQYPKRAHVGPIPVPRQPPIQPIQPELITSHLSATRPRNVQNDQTEQELTNWNLLEPATIEDARQQGLSVEPNKRPFKSLDLNVAPSDEEV